MPESRYAREESWDSQIESEISADDGYNPQDAMREGDDVEPLMTIGDVHRALHPLQATADRVGRQAEQFAESLDRLSPRSNNVENPGPKDVLPLVREYEKIATETVKRLRRYHEPERQELLQKSLSRRMAKEDGKSTPSEFYREETAIEPNATYVEDLEHWEHERQTWQLLNLMLETRSETVSPPAGLPETLVRPTHTSKPHRYSNEREVWEYYLEQSPEMWEKHVVVEWLKMNANSMGQDIDNIVEQLESDTERGSDLWAHGWLYSKESIKAEKRLRSLAEPLEPTSLSRGNLLLSKEGNEKLVTQLDPDAFSRQDRALAKQDAFFERATWIACWEMVRRGYSWDKIRSWSKERIELWRSLSLRGDPRPFHDTPRKRERHCNWQSRMLWRKTCMKLARHGGIDDYERAVYGALSGDLGSVQKICRTWDDLLFAHYNSQLLQHFDVFVQENVPAHMHSLPGFDRDEGFAIAATGLNGAQAWEILLHSELTRDEAMTPLKLLQGSMIANRTGSYLVAQAHALSLVLNDGNDESKKLARPFKYSGDDPTALIHPSSYDILRILTHIAFALQDIGQLGPTPHGIEQIVIAYVDFLSKAGKQQLLPLYASRLTPSGAIECMARQLPFITDVGERKTMISLMQQYDMDVPGILLMQLVLITQDRPVDPNSRMGYPPLRILQKAAQGSLPPIKKNFLGDEITDEEWDLINGMEWYLLLDKHWKETMYAGSLVYKYLLLTGALAAARELSRRVPFSTISLKKTEDLLGKSIDLAIFSDDDTSQPTSPVRQHSKQQGIKDDRPGSLPAQRTVLLDEAHTFRDLEALITALDALETFSSVAAAQNQLGADARHAKDWKHNMQRSMDGVASAMEPLLESSWLAQPVSPREGAELAAIRAAYIPEMLLAYISVLGVCGQVLTREILLRSLDVAALVAGAGDPISTTAVSEQSKAQQHRRKSSAGSNPGTAIFDAADRSELAKCFLRAGRMAELVDALAVVGRLIIKADETGGKRGARRSGRRPVTEGLSIWTVSAGKGKGQDDGS